MRRRRFPVHLLRVLRRYSSLENRRDDFHFNHQVTGGGGGCASYIAGLVYMVARPSPKLTQFLKLEKAALSRDHFGRTGGSGLGPRRTFGSVRGPAGGNFHSGHRPPAGPGPAHRLTRARGSRGVPEPRGRPSQLAQFVPIEGPRHSRVLQVLLQSRLHPAGPAAHPDPSPAARRFRLQEAPGSRDTSGVDGVSGGTNFAAAPPRCVQGALTPPSC